MRVGDVLDRSFTLLRREWRAAVLIGVANVVYLLLFVGVFLALGVFSSEVFSGTGSVPTVNDATAISLVLVAVVGGLLFAIAVYVLSGVSVRAAAHGPDEGTDWGGLWGHVGPAIGAAVRIFGWSLLVALVVGVLFIPVALLFGLVDTVEAGAVLAVLLVLGIMFLALVAAVLLAPILLLLVGIVFADSTTIPAAFRQSLDLVKRAYWPAVGASVILYLFSLVPIVGSLLVAVLTPPFQVALRQELEQA